ncbi:thioesterase II family protein [Pseudoalteromonas sp. ASV78]|uniref:thioesterase II family protein n=1 Tax=Pseudoalteromonas sp. ASV78 TaxID=3397851 RepID=UPI0039FD74AF
MTNKLFFIPEKKPNARVRLFCFPYAGGSPSLFLPWTKLINSDIELVLIQLPGRGSRMGEPAADNMLDVINELLSHSEFITSKPYAFFGHSLGSRVAYELTSNFQRSGKPMPIKLFASASRAPHTKNNKASIYDLPYNEFIAELKSLNGTPTEVLENEELMALLAPLLRADFKIADTYSAEVIPLSSPIRVLNGKHDQISAQQLNAWQDLSQHPVDVSEFDGGHFFIHQYSAKMVKLINQDLLQQLN